MLSRWVPKSIDRDYTGRKSRIRACDSPRRQSRAICQQRTELQDVRYTDIAGSSVIIAWVVGRGGRVPTLPTPPTPLTRNPRAPRPMTWATGVTDQRKSAVIIAYSLSMDWLGGSGTRHGGAGASATIAYIEVLRILVTSTLSTNIFKNGARP